MSAAVPVFPAPDWAEPTESEAVDRFDYTTVFWSSRNYSTHPAFQVKLLKVDSLEDGERSTCTTAEIQRQGGSVEFETLDEVEQVIAALQALAVTWRNAERTSE